ncbi:MAG TPA: molybdopterin biosynthesis protein MoeB, partial [Sphingobium sp.]|nr:molybdopterin biosynthesis protein MoeB [Sphingobium sp.]
MTLTDAQLDRYARHIVLREIGGAGQMRLLNADVVVIGAGGIGSPAILYLAAAGVGTIRVIDDDVVALSNLQRQVLFGTDDIGSPKAEAAMAAVARINPDVK